MESGKADGSAAADGRRGRRKQTEEEAERRMEKKRLEPCSSIWPGPIRLTAFWDLSGASAQVRHLDS